MTLKHWLDREGMTAYRLAKNIGVTPATIGNLLSGKGASLATALKIHEATAGQVDLRDMLPNGVVPAKPAVQELGDLSASLRRDYPEVFAPAAPQRLAIFPEATSKS